MDKKQIHLIANAHLDPVWLWRFPEGLAEIKATYKAAIDRIKEHDSFIFTAAAASYYKWIEDNCPKLFEDIQAAVKAGRWCIVGGMWVQPDCNIPSSESFARHLLYSKNYFKEKFGIDVKTGYNVDSFGHSGGLPRLLNEAGIENYVYMRPDWQEKDYGFPNQTYRWKCGDNEVVATKIGGYGGFESGKMTQRIMQDNDEYVDDHNESIMKFYGCGNHGGGPTVKSIQEIDEYLPKAKNEFYYSDPDKFYKFIREKHYDELPVYEYELQNDASGCYSANAKIKALNRAGESRMNEAERMEVLSNAVMGTKMDPDKNREAWFNILFNQFHDIICGCSIKEAYEDAYAFGGASVAHGLKLTNEAAQRISWDIDTARDIPNISKTQDWVIWDNGVTGAPIVVFNPLSHSVSIPVFVHRKKCTAIKDEQGNNVSYQSIRASANNTYVFRFIAEVPAYGWKTFWSYDNENEKYEPDAPYMKASEHCIENDKITVKFDEKGGFISSITDKNGVELAGKCLAKTIVLDDSYMDTWGHDYYVYDKVIGEFTDPKFEILECGPCEVKFRVTTYYKESSVANTYSLYAGDDRVHVKARLILNSPEVQIKVLFDSGIKDSQLYREVPGGVVSYETGGREEPMLRWMAALKDGKGLAVVNDSKYSASFKDGIMAILAVRSCYYADHAAKRDNQTKIQDIGEHEFAYDIVPYKGDLADIFRAAEELNTQFPVIQETYHYGTLPQTSSNISLDGKNVTVSAIKPAEDGNGFIVRLTEISGKESDLIAEVLGTKITTHVRPYDIQSFRIADGKAVRVDFTEKVK